MHARNNQIFWALTRTMPLAPVHCHAGEVPGCGLQQLSQLSLHGCALTGLQQLQPGPRLRNLQLFRNSFTRCSMRQLVDNCPGLVEVRSKNTTQEQPKQPCSRGAHRHLARQEH